METKEVNMDTGFKAKIKFEFSRFSLPPIADALVVGKRANIGLNAICKACDEMTPGMFKLIEADHPVIEGLIIKTSDLRKIPENELVPLIIKYAERIMDETDSLHIVMDIKIIFEREVEIK